MLAGAADPEKPGIATFSEIYSRFSSELAISISELILP
jgi:hypothetical protein